MHRPSPTLVWLLPLAGLAIGDGRASAQLSADPAAIAATMPPLTVKPILGPQVLATLTRILADGLHAPTRQGRSQTLLALARLRDPSLQPLFSLLAYTGPSEDRADAIIALAVLEPKRGLDSLLLRQLASDSQRARVLVASIEQGLVSVEQLLEISHWPDLGERSTILVAAQLAGLGTSSLPEDNSSADPGVPVTLSPDSPVLPSPVRRPASPGVTEQSQPTRYVTASAALRRMAKGDDLEIAAAAAAVLAQQGESAGLTRLSRLTPRLAQPNNAGAATAVLGRIASARLDALGEWCLVLAAQPGVTPDVAELAISSAARSGSAATAVVESIMSVARRAADPGKSAAGGSAPGTSGPDGQIGQLRIRLCTLVLDAAAVNPRRLPSAELASLAKAVTPGEFAALTAAVLRVAALAPLADDAMAGEVVRMLELMDRQVPGPMQQAVVRWATAWSSQQPFQIAQRTREAVLRQLLTTNSIDLIESASEAARLLIEIDPGAALPLLSGGGAGRRRLTAALLLGALASGNPDSSAIADFALPTLPPGDKLAGLALLVQTRHPSAYRMNNAADSVSKPEAIASRLAGLATGDGEFSAQVRMQAAWLAIRASDQQRPTLARLLVPVQNADR